MTLTVADIKGHLRDHRAALLIMVVIIMTGFFLPRLLQGTDNSSNGNTVAFQHDCIDLVLHQNSVLPACASLAAMKAAYNVDANLWLVAAQGRMITTARQIAEGHIYNDKVYRACLKSGECVPVPVLTPDIDRNSAKGRAVNIEFWHLVNHGGVTAGTCAMLDICQALVKIGIMPQPAPAMQP